MTPYTNLWKRIAHALPAVAVAGVLFYFSSLSHIDLPLEEISFNDLIIHGIAYFFFGVTLLFAAYPTRMLHLRPVRVYAVLLAIGMLYGMSDEIHQAFVPNRTCTFEDFVADSIGVAAALGARHLWTRWRETKVLNRRIANNEYRISK